jgi:hypothetical protein
VLTGGHVLKQPGNHYAPTVLTDIPKDSPAYREELFGHLDSCSIFRCRRLRGSTDRTFYRICRTMSSKRTSELTVEFLISV